MKPSTPMTEWPDDDALLAALHSWMPDRRWFPLKGDAAPALSDLSIAADLELAPGVRDLLIAASRPAGAPPVLIHVPLVLAPVETLDSFSSPGETPGAWGVRLPDSDLALVDGAHHPAFWRAWAEAARAAGTVLAGGAEAIAARADSGRVMTGEQSNTNVVMPRSEGPSDALDADIVVKLFRVLAAGRNPDVEVSAALAGDGWDRVRTPVAWSTLEWDDPATGERALTDSAVACIFIPKADDGFELFCSFAKNDDGPAGPVRTRALALAEDLGATTAQMHEHMASALGTADPVPAGELADSLRTRAHWAMDEVGELEERIPGLRVRVDEVLAELEGVRALERATRIHGDYHLGQVLRELDAPFGSAARWFVLDFEGEPLRPLAERSKPDQPMRDLAGMLRSFDYAAAVGGAKDPKWLACMRTAFIDGYRATALPLEGDAVRARKVLLDALELDKALYEAVYEARNRPDWLAIPLHGIAALVG